LIDEEELEKELGSSILWNRIKQIHPEQTHRERNKKIGSGGGGMPDFGVGWS
jgi:hypothetical protein